MANIEVILKEKIEKLGAEADVVQVKTGYAQNYLVPRGKALLATKSNMRQLEALTTGIDAGAINSFVLEGSELVTLTQALPDGYYVVLVVDRSTSKALALNRLRRTAKVIAKEIF